MRYNTESYFAKKSPWVTSCVSTETNSILIWLTTPKDHCIQSSQKLQSNWEVEEPSTHQHHHFSTKDKDCVFLQNVGHLPTSLHGGKTQKNSINIITMETSNIKNFRDSLQY
jgi:hypothetical protein